MKISLSARVALLGCGLAATAHVAAAAPRVERATPTLAAADSSGPGRVGVLAIGARADASLAAVAVNVDGIVKPGVLGVRNGEIIQTAQATSSAQESSLAAIAQSSAGLANSVIAGILGSAARDGADLAFGTDNVDFAIRKGYVTTIGRVRPGIDRVNGDLGTTHCDTQVMADGSITAASVCSEPKR
jgi:hypothetical protein